MKRLLLLLFLAGCSTPAPKPTPTPTPEPPMTADQWIRFMTSRQGTLWPGEFGVNLPDDTQTERGFDTNHFVRWRRTDSTIPIGEMTPKPRIAETNLIMWIGDFGPILPDGSRIEYGYDTNGYVRWR